MSPLAYYARILTKPYCEITMLDSLSVLALVFAGIFAYAWLSERRGR